MIDYDLALKRKLQRFLDATRAELFFARKILMVEGIAEALLLPIFARIAGGCLKESAVTVLNADGINFNAFIPLFGNNRIGLPVAILTDGDDIRKTGSPSATTSGLKTKEADISNLLVEYSQITFEHELARSSVLLPFMLKAYESLHPINGATLKTTIATLANDEAKADAFLNEFLRNKTSKGKFAQELAGYIEEAATNIAAEAIPQYIRNAFLHLGVINYEGSNDPDGETTGTNSCSGTN
jgi:putative ATP-dependent endonuclease of the OLD family